jgi:hypothetical protein
MTRTLMVCGLLILLLAVTLLAGCGGGNSGDPTPPPTKIYLFVTTIKYNGNLKAAYSSARAGADALVKLPDNLPAGLVGKTVHAFISVSANDCIVNMPTTFHFPSNIPIVTPNETQMAANWSDLFVGISSNLGTLFPAMSSDYWWSGSYEDGTFDTDNNCNNWSSNDNSSHGRCGNRNTIGPAWVSDYASPGNSANHLIGIAY